MYCRKIVIISGQDREYADTKGILTLSTEQEGVAAKLSVYRLSPKPTEYLCVIACEGERSVYTANATGGIDVAFMTGLNLTPTCKISVLVGVKDSGKPIAYGSNSGTPMWESGLVRELQPDIPAVVSIESSDKKASATERFVADVPIAARNLESPRPEETKPVLQRSREETAAQSTKTDFERAKEKARAVYDDERIADYNYYSDTFERRIEGGKYVAHREAAAASLDAWGGYNTVFRPRLRVDEASVKKSDAVPKYYLSVKTTLDAMFRTSAGEEVLNAALTGTRWIKVPYKENRYYCVGLVGDLPDYIGYAVPGVYELNPPRQLESVSKWIPLSREEPQGQGYWVMFQDAVTGATVKLG